MARDIHYQEVGNPIQMDRLPKERPELALPYRPMTWPQELRASGTLVVLLVILGVLTMATELLHLTKDYGGYARLLNWVNCFFLMAGAALVHQAIGERTTLPLKLPMLCLAASYVYMNLRLPFEIQLVVTAAAFSFLTWHIGLHWLFLCTTAGLAQDQAATIQRRGLRYLRLVAMIPVMLVLVHFFTGSYLLPAILLLTAVAFVITPIIYRHGVKSLRVGVSAAVSWLVYNRYDAALPGTFSSPSGPFAWRLVLTGSCVLLSAIALLRLPLQWMTSAASNPRGFSELTVIAGSFTWLDPWVFTVSPEAVVFWLFCAALVCAAPVLITLTVPTSLILQLLLWANSFRSITLTPDRWKRQIDRIHCSRDKTERESIYIGRVESDGSPLLVPRTVFDEHAHFLGDSGGGKTAIGLAPVVTQLILGGECSVVLIDLKADTLELLATLQAAAKERSARTGKPITTRHFSNQPNLETFAFNPLQQSCWQNMEGYIRTDILCGACGLTYGSDYGEGYYSSANAAVLYETQKQFPHTPSFNELTHRIRQVTSTADRQVLHPEIRKAGVHVQTVMDRLASFESLNVSTESGHPDSVLDHAIDLADVFREPQVLYFHLSSTLAPGSSPEIARLVTYMLLAAAAQAERRHPVYLVIDEFQRMVARNIEYMLQLARSMGIGIIIANQSMEDLKTSTADLIPAIEANCRYRQWFSISAKEDRDRLIAGSGETVDYFFTETTTSSSSGESRSFSRQEHLGPRLTTNDITLASDHPMQSIVRISRGAGYAQFGGMPLRVESDFHITKHEYEQRKAMPWPSGDDGTFIPGTLAPQSPHPSTTSGPVVTTEVIAPPSGRSRKKKPSSAFESFFEARKPAEHSSKARRNGK